MQDKHVSILTSSASSNERHKILFLNSVFLLAGVVAFGMGFVRWQSSVVMGLIDFIFSALAIGLLFYLRRHNDKVAIVSTLALIFSYLLFMAIYLMAAYNSTRISLFFLLAASAFFLKGRTVGKLWLAGILVSIVSGHFLHKTGYSHIDIITSCIYLVAMFFVFENYEQLKEQKFAEESEQRFRRLFESSPDPVWIIEDNHFMECNQAAVEMLGYPDKASLTNTHPSALSPEHQPDGESSFTKAERMMSIVQEKGLHRFEWVHRRKDGSDFFAEVTLSALTLQDRPVIYCVWRDITERKQSEIALQESKSLLQTVIDHVPARIFWKDRELNYLGCNPAFAQDAGKESPVEIIGKDDYQMGWSSNADQYRADDQKVINTDMPKINFEEPQIRPDGQQIWLRTSKVPLKNQNDEIIGVLGLYEDITESKKNEEELRRYREELEDLVQQRTADLQMTLRKLSDTQFAMDEAGIGIHWVNAETGQFIFVNRFAANLLGYSVEEMAQLSVMNIDPNFFDEKFAEISQELKIKGNLKFESVQRTKDGGLVPVEVSVYYLKGQEGIADRFAAFIIDIRDRKEAEQKLLEAKSAAESASIAKSGFLANMSHEIRTPMNAIIGMTDLTLATELSDRQRNFVEKIKIASNTLLNIINDILDFSKIEAGKLEMESIAFTLEEVFDNLSSIFALRAESQGIELAYEIDDDSRLLVGDPMRLGQVLTNLVSNALKFSAGGNVIVRVATLQANENEVELHFSVIDEGIGMSVEQITRLFQSFTQADSSTTRKFGGTGLGLAISRRLVEMMNGRIWVESVVDHGSTFHFTVKLGVAGTDRRHGIVRFAAGLAEYANRPLLLVDDNLVALRILSHLIEQLGLKVDTAQNTTEALSYVNSEAVPDYLVCLIDWHMPDVDGIESIRRLRKAFAARNLKSPPMLLVTAYSHQAEIDTVSEEIDGLLAKPVNVRHLYVELAHCLGILTQDQPDFDRRQAITPEWACFRDLDILLVEDVEINQEVILELLVSVGLSARLAKNGVEALAAVAEKMPDLILMDCQMPIMDGYEATQRLRSRPEYKDLPIIALTANATLEDQEKCFAVGMNAHVPKPIRMNVLYDKMVLCLPSAIASTAYIKLPPKIVDKANAGDLQDFPGIDSAAGLAFIGGKVSAYLRMLRKFRDKQLNTFRHEFEAAREAEDWEVQHRLAHSLKGVAYSLGAMQLGEAAFALEMAAKNEDSERSAQFLLNVLTELQVVIEGLADLDDMIGKLKVDTGLESAPEKGNNLKVQTQPATSQSDEVTATSLEALLKRDHAGKRVLIAEDNVVNRDLVGEMLSETGLVLDFAEDGKVALNKAQANTYDLILMDMQMPEMSGVDAAKAIRQLPAYATTPIIAMTGNAFAEDRKACLEVGMNDHLAKPMKPEDLYQALLKWLGGEG